MISSILTIAFISNLALLSIILTLLISNIQSASIEFGFYITVIACSMYLYAFLFPKAIACLYWQFGPNFVFNF
jgi:hypothetical protein